MLKQHITALVVMVTLALCGVTTASSSSDFPRRHYPPPHMNLWLCLHGTPSLGTRKGHEASTWDNRDTGHNYHYGGLQMHRKWGYGTSEYAYLDPMLVQVWAAEYAYKASHYSSTFLVQQWGQTITPCWKYA